MGISYRAEFGLGFKLKGPIEHIVSVLYEGDVVLDEERYRSFCTGDCCNDRDVEFFVVLRRPPLDKLIEVGHILATHLRLIGLEVDGRPFGLQGGLLIT